MANPTKNQNQILTDGQANYLGGVDSGKHPAIINPDQIAFALNVTLRGGFPRSRPKFLWRIMTFESDEQDSWVKSHMLQGADLFTNERGETIHVASIGGRIFTVNTQWKVSEITPTRATATTVPFTPPAISATITVTVADADKIYVGYPVLIGGKEYVLQSKSGNDLLLVNNTDDGTLPVVAGAIVSFLDINDPNTEQAWMQQAETWFVIQNDLDGAILFNGSTSRRSNILGGKPEVPTGSMMEYAQGRLWVVVNKRYVAAGDLFDPFDANSVITFSEEVESVILSGRFVMPSHMPITGIKVIPNLDTVQGQGPLLVFTQDIIASINVPFNRALWKQQVDPVVRLVQSNYGGVSQESIVVVNGDIWNRAIGGIRTFQMARAKYYNWSNVAQSGEVDRALLQDTDELLHLASGILFDNRLLMTFGPLPSPNGVKHRGVVAMDFDVISSVLKDPIPVWEGAWTGVRPTRLVSGIFNNKQRAFAWSLNADNQNELWEITKDYGFDNDVNRIRSFVEFRSFDFKTPVQLKKLSALEVWTDEIVGQVDFTIHWLPDYLKDCWFEWGTKQLCAQYRDCDDDIEVCKTLKTFSPGHKTRWGLGQPPDDCEPFDNKPGRIGYRHQLRIDWIGQCALKEVLVRAEEVPEPQYPPC